MSTPRWRLAIVAGALLLLMAVGTGLAQAAPTAASTTGETPTAVTPAEFDPDQVSRLGERLRALRDRFGDGPLRRLRQHLVHGTFTLKDRDGDLITIQLDHGTISAIGDGTITIAEAGDTSVTVATNADTKVRKDREPASVDALEIGDEVVVHSMVEGGSATAQFIVVPTPAAAAAPGEGAA
jgi:hypothetical protein